ncbi:MAG: MFS transporter, partial [Bacillota bacterium]|nr:MFS transporter [Bacillota bacterium]
MLEEHNNIIKWLFIANAVIFGVGNFARQIYAPLLLTIQEAFQINYSLAGLLMTAAFIGYALFRFPSGLLSDAVGQIPVILIANIFFTGSILLAYLSPNYLLFLLATFIMGCMSGLYVTAGYSYGTTLGGEEHIGRSTGLLETFGTAGSIVAPFVVTLFLVWFSWRDVFLLAFLIM